MLLKQLLGLLGGRHFFDPVGDVSLMVEKLEDGLIGLPRCFLSFVLGYDREVVAAIAYNQVA